MKGLIISSILMLSFTMYVLFALSGTFGEIPCSCAGLIAAPGWKGHLVFNIIFTIVSLTGIFLFHATKQSFSRNDAEQQWRDSYLIPDKISHSGTKQRRRKTEGKEYRCYKQTVFCYELK